MSAQWVAGNVRARALLNRRLGVGRARALAAMNSLTDAQHALAATAYGRDITVGQPALDTDHAVCAALLWHLRVLAGWQPAQGARAIRALAAGFEANNIAAHARKLAGAPARPPYTLGALGSGWPRLSETRSLAQLGDLGLRLASHVILIGGGLTQRVRFGLGSHPLCVITGFRHEFGRLPVGGATNLLRPVGGDLAGPCCLLLRIVQ